MGTSASSKGPGGGVPMVPPWVPDPLPPEPIPEENDNTSPDGGGEDDEESPEPNQSVPLPVAVSPVVPIAPAARFAGVRRSFGSFARTGDTREMRRGLRHYVRSGYGGGGTATRRFGGTVSTAGALHGALSALSAGQAVPGSSLDRALLRGRSAREVIDALNEVVNPVDGTQDTEARRAATKDALSELLTIFPEADLLNLTKEQRDLAIERFVGIDVYRRICLDVGKTIQDKAPSAVTGLARLKEIKNYVKETVSAAFRRLRAAGNELTGRGINTIVRSAVRGTFRVFEDYVL